MYADKGDSEDKIWEITFSWNVCILSGRAFASDAAEKKSRELCAAEPDFVQHAGCIES